MKEPTQEEIVRVAKAVYDAEYGTISTEFPTWDKISGRMQNHWKRQARVSIIALREDDGALCK